MNYSSGNAVGFRSRFNNDVTKYKWAGFINGENAPFLTYQVDNAHNYLTFISLNTIGGIKEERNVGTAPLTGFHNFEIGWTSTHMRRLVSMAHLLLLYFLLFLLVRFQ